MNELSNGDDGGVPFLKYVLDGWRRLLRESLVKDAEGRLLADYGDGLQRYRLREPSEDSDNYDYYTDHLIYASAVSLQTLLDHPERPDFEYECELLTINLLAANCINGELNKVMLEDEITMRAKNGGKKSRIVTPEVERAARQIHSDWVRTGLGENEALKRTADAVKSKFELKKLSPETRRRYLAQH